MSVERSFEPWEEMQRHGQDLADRLAQGFTGLLQSKINPPPFAWPSSNKKNPFDPDAIFDIGNRLGAEFGACLNGVVQQFFRRLPAPFRPDEGGAGPASVRADLERRGGGGSSAFLETLAAIKSDELADEEGFCFDSRASEHFGRSQASINITSTYDSRTHGVESSLVARGDLWRAEASHGGSTSGNENSPLFLIQLGPVLFVRDTTLLLPVHLSKQHLLWYGYDRKNGMHSLCPALWSKHRRWLLMSMICLNPFSCFPNGQLTYVAGEGLTTSAFLPIFSGLLQAQGQYPGDTRFSFSCKNKRGTRITPMVQWPDKSFSLGVVQALAWKRSGLMVRPTVQFSICPTFGGSNPGLCAELIHSPKEKLSLICGGSYTTHPSAFASLSIQPTGLLVEGDRCSGFCDSKKLEGGLFLLTFIGNLSHWYQTTMKLLLLLPPANEGKFFSNGMDVYYLKGDGRDEPKEYLLMFQRLVSKLLTLCVPTIAVIRGHAVGAGCVFALSHDYRLMNSSHDYIFNERGLPVTPRNVAVLHLRLPSHTFQEAILTSKCLEHRKIDGKSAAACGLIHATSPTSETLLEQGISKAKEFKSRNWRREVYHTLKMEMFKNTVRELEKGGSLYPLSPNI